MPQARCIFVALRLRYRPNYVCAQNSGQPDEYCLSWCTLHFTPVPAGNILSTVQIDAKPIQYTSTVQQCSTQYRYSIKLQVTSSLHKYRLQNTIHISKIGPQYTTTVHQIQYTPHTYKKYKHFIHIKHMHYISTIHQYTMCRSMVHRPLKHLMSFLFTSQIVQIAIQYNNEDYKGFKLIREICTKNTEYSKQYSTQNILQYAVHSTQ